MSDHKQTDRQTDIRRAALEMQRVVRANDILLGDEACHRLARAAYDAIPRKQWFVGVTKDQQELVAAAGLREQSYTVYLPKIHMRWQDGRKIEARSILRFTGYILVAFDPRLDAFGPINNTRGMDGSEGSALCGGERPISLPGSIIETLRGIEDDELALALQRKRPRPRTDLVAGETVEINNPDDPFHGKRGAYLGTENYVARVLVGFFVKEIAEIDLKRVSIQARPA